MKIISAVIQNLYLNLTGEGDFHFLTVVLLSPVHSAPSLCEFKCNF